MNRYKKLVANSGIIAIGTFGSKLLVYFLMPFYTAYLNPEMYSVADNITLMAKLLIPILSVGITETVFRFALDKEYDGKAVFSAGIYTLLAGCTLFALIVPILNWVGYFDGYAYIIVLYVIGANFHALATQYIRTKDHFKFYAVQGIINTSLVIAFNILFLAVFSMGITGYVLSVVLADFVTFFIIFIREKLHRDIVSPRAITRKTVRDMLKYSVPLIPTTILWWITSVSDRFMVTGFSGDMENGIYSVAYKIPNLLVMLCTVFIQAWNFSSVKEDDEGERSKFFENVYRTFAALQFMAGGFIIIAADVFTNFMFAKEYSNARYFIPILAVATVYSCMVSFLGSVYTVKKKSVKAMITALGGAVLNITLNFVLIPESIGNVKLAGMGGLGAAIATLASYLLVFLLRTGDVKKQLPFNMHLPVMAVNSLCIMGQAAIATWRVPGYIFIEAALFAVICGVNLPYMFKWLKRLIFRRS